MGYVGRLWQLVPSSLKSVHFEVFGKVQVQLEHQFVYFNDFNNKSSDVHVFAGNFHFFRAHSDTCRCLLQIHQILHPIMIDSEAT